MKWLEKIRQNDFLLIAAVYFSAFFLMPLNPGAFWDDWSFINIPFSVANREFQTNGNIWFGYFIRLITIGRDYLVSARIVIFILYFVSVWFVYQILKSLKFLEKNEILILAVLFAVFPVNSMRINVIPCSGYALSHACFWTGFYLYSRSIQNNSIISRCLSPLLFLISFSTNSFLFFFAVFIFYIIIQKNLLRQRPQIWLKTACRHIDYAVIVMVFWVIKMRFLQPALWNKGAYNDIYLSKILGSPVNIPYAFYKSFFQVLDLSLSGVSFFMALAFALFIAAILGNRLIIEKKNSLLPGIAFGIIILTAGLFPYLAVGKIPQNYDALSRHQLLVPLGAAVLLYYSTRLAADLFFLTRGTQSFIISMLISLCIFSNINYYRGYLHEYFKQLSISMQITGNKTIQNNVSFLIDDYTTDLNVQRRGWRFYEYCGILKKVFGDDRRFCGIFEDYNFLLQNRVLYRDKLPLLNCGSFDFTPPSHIITIKQGSYHLAEWDFIRLPYLYLCKPVYYRTSLENLLAISVEPLNF
ncbi:MAG: hypothetical protein A2096_08225 [Spirochaetes bacterium GWF1_41_5]|nr:MAG: hypothetical protein A2096_08225 [Spirochaetes bacterium GWF1_41_5]